MLQKESVAVARSRVAGSLARPDAGRGGIAVARPIVTTDVLPTEVLDPYGLEQLVTPGRRGRPEESQGIGVAGADLDEEHHWRVRRQLAQPEHVGLVDREAGELLAEPIVDRRGRS